MNRSNQFNAAAQGQMGDQSQLFRQFMARRQQQGAQSQQGIVNPGQFHRSLNPGLLPTPVQRPGMIPGPRNPGLRPEGMQNPSVQSLPMQAGQQLNIQNLPMQMGQQAQLGFHRGGPNGGQQQAPASGPQAFLQAAIQQGHDPQMVMNFMRSKMGGQNAPI